MANELSIPLRETTKQEEIRKILRHLQVKSIDNHTIATRLTKITKPLNMSSPEELLGQAYKALSDIGLVIKAERELPECGVELKKHLDKHGFEAVEPLIGEG